MWCGSQRLVAVTDGALTLTGHVPTYVEKLAEARAAERVRGQGGGQRADGQIFPVAPSCLTAGDCCQGLSPARARAPAERESHVSDAVCPPWRQRRRGVDRRRIDVCVADRLQELLLRITRAHGPRLLLDFADVSFMDFAGLRALVLTLRHAELCGWSMHLTAASAMVRKVITLTGAEDALPVRDQVGNSSSGDAEAAARRGSN